MTTNRADGVNESTTTIGNTVYTSAQVGALNGKLDFDKVAPYVGIGWGNPFGKSSRWSISLDLGTMLQDSPNVELNANGLLASNAAFMADLNREKVFFFVKLSPIRGKIGRWPTGY